MCGIAGILGIAPERARPAIERMVKAMAHRGPDDCGTQVVMARSAGAQPVFLAQTRLSILDLSPAGHQPMRDIPATASDANWIVFNGEVFNYLEFHPQLQNAGWKCRSTCDTEVILHAYRVWGEACVERFRGMFAWCLLDSATQTAWFCRDRLGKKPLYMTRPPGGGLIFASEVRTLLAAGPELVAPEIAPEALESYLAQGAVFGYDSIIRNVSLLPPATSLVTDWSGKEIRQRRYWKMPFQPAPTTSPAPGDRAAAVSGLAKTLREAVQLRLIADVPLGLFLSSGIDSTALATIATEVSTTPIRTISIGFDQPEWDESTEAEAIAKQLGTEHQTVRLTGEGILSELGHVLDFIDQPTDDGFNTYYVSRAARRAGLTVALSGVGGDELFGGYASFRDVPKALKTQRRLNSFGFVRPLLRRLAGLGRSRRAAKIVELLRRPATPVQLYLLRRELFLEPQRRALFDRPSGSDPYSGVPASTIAELDALSGKTELTNLVSYFELSAYLRHMLLRDSDVFGMANGLEIRAPLLDHHLVGEAVALPGVWKSPVPYPKPLLVDAVGARFPRQILNRPKRGFTFPWEAWLRGPLRERVRESAENEALWEHLGLHPRAPRELFARFIANDRRVSALQLLALVVLAHYATRYSLQRRRE